MDSIVLPNDFDVSKISYSQPRVLDNGGRVIYVSYDKKPMRMQLPFMSAPFGLNDGKSWGGEDTAGKPEKFSIDLSFKGKETRDTLNKCFENFVDLQKKIVNDAFTHSQLWMKKSFKSVDVVEELASPIVKFPKDKEGNVTDKYPPTFKVNLPYRDGSFLVDVYDRNKNLVDLKTSLVKGAKVSAIVQCVGIWIIGGNKFSCSWKAVQLQVIPPQNITGFAFKEVDDKLIDDDVEEEEEVHESANGATGDNETKLASDEEDELVESSDDELDAKPAKVVKKVSAKKK